MAMFVKTSEKISHPNIVNVSQTNGIFPDRDKSKKTVYRLSSCIHMMTLCITLLTD